MRLIRFASLIACMGVATSCSRAPDESTPAPAPGQAMPSTAPTPAAPQPQQPAPAANEATSAQPKTAQHPLRSGVPTEVPTLPPGTATPPLAEGASMVYTCEDGSTLDIKFAEKRAEWTMPTGSVVQMEQVPVAGGETYAGGGYRLLRVGNTVELGKTGAQARRCLETSGSA